MQAVTKIFSDDVGNLSCMRIVFVLVVVVILINWTIINIITGELNPLDWGAVAAIVGMGGTKAYQKSSESERPDLA